MTDDTMTEYTLSLKVSGAMPAPSITFSTPSNRMAIDYTKRILEHYARHHLIPGAFLFDTDNNVIIAEFECRTQINIQEVEISNVPQPLHSHR